MKSSWLKYRLSYDGMTSKYFYLLLSPGNRSFDWAEGCEVAIEIENRRCGSLFLFARNYIAKRRNFSYFDLKEDIVDIAIVASNNVPALVIKNEIDNCNYIISLTTLTRDNLVSDSQELKL